MSTPLDSTKVPLPEQIAWLKGLMSGERYAEDKRMVESIISALWPSDEQERALWDSAITAALKECYRLNSGGKDDQRDSWMGNAVKAISKLYAPDLHKDSEY